MTSPIYPELPELPEPACACTKRTAAWVLCLPKQRLESAHGPLVFDQGSFEHIVANFDGDRNPVPVTTAERRQFQGATEAVGWVLKLEVREDGLYAFIDFTEKGAEMVRKREVRIVAPVVLLDDPHAHRPGMKLLNVDLE